MAASSTKSYFPLAGGADDGWSNEDEATATCFCGCVQLVFVSSLFCFVLFCSVLFLQEPCLFYPD